PPGTQRRLCVGRAAIEDAGDVGMVHHGQGLTFRLEAGHDLPRVHPQLDDLERYATTNRLALFGHVDTAEPAFADLFEEPVRADGDADRFVYGCRRAGYGGMDRHVRKRPFGRVYRKQPLNPTFQSRILLAALVDESGPLISRHA